MINEGQDIVTVQHNLGHARASTTLDQFAHQWHRDRTGSAWQRALGRR